MSSRYLSRRSLSDGPRSRLRPATSPTIQSRMLWLAWRRDDAIGVVVAGAEQQIERDARVADHRQRLARARPADRVGVGAGVVVVAAAGLIEVLDAELHRRDRRVLAELLARTS